MDPKVKGMMLGWKDGPKVKGDDVRDGKIGLKG